MAIDPGRFRALRVQLHDLVESMGGAVLEIRGTRFKVEVPEGSDVAARLQRLGLQVHRREQRTRIGSRDRATTSFETMDVLEIAVPSETQT